MLFLFGLVLIATLGLVINRNTGVLSSHRTLRFVVDDIKGLAEGNPVQIAGMKVGSVTGMEFTREGARRGVEVRLSIQSEHFDMISADSRAVIKQVGMLGDKIVEIQIGSLAASVADGATLPVLAASGLSEAMDSGMETLSSVGSISRRLDGLLTKVDRGEGSLGRLMTTTELVDELTGTVADLRKVTGRLSEGDGALWRALEDRRMAEDFSRTIASLDQMSGELRQVSQSINAGRGTIGKLVRNDSLYDDLRGTARHADSMIVGLAEPINSFAPGSQLYSNLNRSIEALDSLLSDMKKRPSRYVQFSVFK
ncbi:MAG TPA: MlaD family protein [Candidatus Kapabacteria bacterium]|nr:MlaD family protein [Candidatus Kapabacteria bacterium]